MRRRCAAAMQRQRIVEVVGLLVEVARAQAEVDAGLLALDGQRDGAGERGRQRLRAAHAAETGGEDPATGQAAAEVLAAGFDEGLVGALDDALAADVDPAAGGHLAVHDQALAVQLVEVFPGRPLRHQVGVGDQDARRVGVGLEHADRLARLHQQGFVVLQLLQRARGSCRSSPSCAPPGRCRRRRRALRVLGDLGIEVVLDHPERRLDLPVGAGNLRAARRADGPRLGESVKGRQVGHGGSRGLWQGSNSTCLDRA